MNIGLIIFAIIGSIIGLASTFYIVISMFWILGVKIVRRIKHQCGQLKQFIKILHLFS